MDLLAVYAAKIVIAAVAIQVIVPIKSGAKIESVLSIKAFHIVLNATKIAEKDYCQRSNLLISANRCIKSAERCAETLKSVWACEAFFFTDEEMPLHIRCLNAGLPRHSALF